MAGGSVHGLGNLVTSHMGDIVDTLRERARGGFAYDNDLDVAADEIERLRAALEMIAGKRPCPDNLLGNDDIARIALEQDGRESK